MIVGTHFPVDFDKYAYISANATVTSTATSPGESCIANFRIGVDDASGDPLYDRVVDLRPDSANGTHKTLAITAIVPVTASPARFAHLVGRTPTAGCTITVINPTLTVLTPIKPTLDQKIYLPLVIRYGL
jgi:hypothetical protein